MNKYSFSPVNIYALYLFTVIIGDPKYNVKTDRECFENIVKHSSSASALALNLLDNLVPKEVQHISNIKGVFGKAPLDLKILAAIRGILMFIAFLNLPGFRLVYNHHYHEYNSFCFNFI